MYGTGVSVSGALSKREKSEMIELFREEYRRYRRGLRGLSYSVGNGNKGNL